MAGSSPAGNSTSTTGPVIRMTRPVALGAFALGGAAVAMLVSVPPGSCSGSARLRAGRDLDHLAGDVGLADLVVGQRQVVDQVFGVLGCVLHRHHPARLIAGLALQERLEDAGGDVARQELLEDGGRRGL